MLDSGVFSAWNVGAELSIRDYIKFIDDNADLFDTYVNMDKIPGRQGTTRTQAQAHEAARVSLDNLHIMKKAGLRPIPVFHQLESLDWLHRMLDEGEEYIGISVNKNLPQHSHTPWLDLVFTHLTDKNGNPLIRTHGFGITSVPMLLRYPWFSCDSTTWTLNAGFGQLWAPKYTNGEPDYTMAPTQFVASDFIRHGGIVNRTDKCDFVHEDEKLIEYGILLDYAMRHGFSMSDIRYIPLARYKLFLSFFKELSANNPLKPFPNRVGSFLTSPPDIKTKSKPWKHIKLVQVTSYDRKWSHILTEMDWRDRLLSYYDLRERPIEELRGYIKTGETIPYKEPKWAVNWGSNYTSRRRVKLLKRMQKAEADNEDQAE